MRSNQFESLALKKELLKNLAQLNFKAMTPIQALSLPLILKGHDLIAQAKTGSGKTAAFGLGILESLNVSNIKTQSLILCPTRELADQVAKEIRTLARVLKNIKVLTITGGQSEYHQEKSLSHGAHIIIGTPGRILKLLRTKKLNLSTVNSLVLDEADRMLEMGFYDDILTITDQVPKKRQTLLLSATFPDEIKELSKKLQHHAEMVKVDSDHSKEVIEQQFFKLDSHKDKPQALLKILSHFRPTRFIVFCKTKVIADAVTALLVNQNISARSIHGDLMQNERTAALTLFSHRSLSALVATDVAARGLDIEELEMVINYDLPSSPEVYVHRVGRTARAGKTGMALSLFTLREEHKLQEISECQSKELKDLPHSSPYDLIPPMTSLYISAGKRDKLRPADIVGAILGETGLDFEIIGKITINTIISFVAVKSEVAGEVMTKLNAGKIKNRNFKVGLL